MNTEAALPALQLLLAASGVDPGRSFQASWRGFCAFLEIPSITRDHGASFQFSLAEAGDSSVLYLARQLDDAEGGYSTIVGIQWILEGQPRHLKERDVWQTDRGSVAAFSARVRMLSEFDFACRAEVEGWTFFREESWEDREHDGVSPKDVPRPTPDSPS
jgi:hypothetical protein